MTERRIRHGSHESRSVVRKHNLKVPLIRVVGESATSTDWVVSKISAEGTILDNTGAGEALLVRGAQKSKNKNVIFDF